MQRITGQRRSLVQCCSRISVITIGIAVLITVAYWKLFKFEFENSESHIELLIPNDIDLFANFHQASCLTNPQLAKTMQILHDAKTSIWKEWDIDHYPLFLGMMHIPRKSWDIQKLKFIKAILERNNNNSLPFVVGFSGSSVTAGHDNYFKEAYPQVFLETMNPIFTSLNISLVVRNQALGNNPCYAYDACVSTHIGSDVDILTWEQSMNCGRDPRPVESFIRAATVLSKLPTIMYILSGTPYWDHKDCPYNVSFERANLTDTEMQLLRLPMIDVTNSQTHLQNMLFLKPNKESTDLTQHYTGVAHMGQNVMSVLSYKCRGPYGPDFCSKTPWVGVSGDNTGGVSWHPGRRGHRLRAHSLALAVLSMLEDALASLQSTVKQCSSSSSPSSSLDNGSDRSDSSAPPAAWTNNSSALSDMHQQQQQQQPNTSASGVNHHQHHQKRLLRQLNEASAKGQLAAQPRQTQLIAFYHDTVTALASYQQSTQARDIKPLYCDPLICRTAAVCLTDFQPKVHGNTLAAQVVIPREAPSGVSNTTNSPSSDSLASRFVSRLVNSSWTQGLSALDWPAVLKTEARHLGYSDRKIVYTSHGSDRLTLRINPTAVTGSPIWLCECQKGFVQYPSDMTDLDKGARVFVTSLDSGSGTTPHEEKELTLKLFADQCYQTTSLVLPGAYLLSVGQRFHNISVRFLSVDCLRYRSDHHDQINLAYVLYW